MAVFSGLSLKSKLLLGLIPSVVFILLITGYITYTISLQFINEVLGRTVKLQNMAIAHEIESYLQHCREDLLYVAQEDINPEIMKNYLAKKWKDLRSIISGICVYFANR